MRHANKIIQLILVLLVIFTITGCATIFTGPTQEIRFESNKPVHIYIKGTYIGKTPVTYRLNKGMMTVKGSGTLAHLPITIEGSNGSQTINLLPGTNEWMWGDLILGISIGGSICYFGITSENIDDENILLFSALCGIICDIPLLFDATTGGSLYKYPKIIKINVVE